MKTVGGELFRMLHQREGTFDLGRAEKHMEQWPRMLGGDNFIADGTERGGTAAAYKV